MKNSYKSAIAGGLFILGFIGAAWEPARVGALIVFGLLAIAFVLDGLSDFFKTIGKGVAPDEALPTLSPAALTIASILALGVAGVVVALTGV